MAKIPIVSVYDQDGNRIEVPAIVGRSAYQSAQKLGYTGSEEEWIESLRGKDGRGIKSILRTEGDGTPGTTDTYTITYTDNESDTFTIHNGIDRVFVEEKINQLSKEIGKLSGLPDYTEADENKFLRVVGGKAAWKDDTKQERFLGTDKAGARLVVGDNGYITTEFPETESTETGELVVVEPTAGTDITVISQINQPVWSYGQRIILRHLNSPNVINIAEILRKKYGGNTWTVDGLTCTINDDDTLTITGTATADDGYANPVTAKDDDIGYFLFPAGTYTIPGGGYAVDFSVTPINPDGWVNLKTQRGTFTTDVPFFVSTIAMSYKSGKVVDETIPLAMVMGSTFPSSGWKYSGDEYRAIFSDKVQTGSFDWHTGEFRDVDGTLVQTVTPIPALKAKEGKNYIFTGAGTSEVTYITSGSSISGAGASGGERFDPEGWGLPVLYLTGDVSLISKENAVALSYTYGGESGTCSLKWQGSSSLAYYKKNYTINFDTAFEAAAGWGEHTKYCLKANYIDHSHARNIVNARLWGQIVASRDPVPAVFSDLPNYGAVDGFPVLIVLNNKFHGLYTFNIPKDAWMMGMGNGTNECILCAGNACPANGFKGEANLTDDFEIEYISDENNTEWAVTSVNRLINACINSDGADLDTTIAQYLDWNSAIDYYIFAVVVEGADITLKNYILTTFDGTKWHFSAYDLDSTHGLYWDGSKFLPANNNPSFVSYATQHRVMELIKLYKKDALKARYNELRESVLSESNVSTMFNNLCGQIPSSVYTKEAKTWPMIPNTSVNNVSQIRDYYRMRAAYADKWIENL